MHGKTILIVDDELSILVPLQFLMEKEGYQPKLAQSGKEGGMRLGGLRSYSGSPFLDASDDP